MQPTRPKVIQDWGAYRMAAVADPDAAERARLLTAQAMADDYIGRQRMEEKFGVDFCRVQYPEAYGLGFGRLLDRIRRLTPW